MPMSADAVWWLLAGLLSGFAIGVLVARRRGREAAGRARVEPAPIPTVTDVVAAPPVAETPTRPPSMRTIDVAAARAAGFNLRHAEDLTIIEGIGRHVEELLRSHDIMGFAQLARRPVADLHAILEDGGPHFQYTRPEAWPRQALLASENRWAELKALQAGRFEPESREGESAD